jgi:hypothetical protein
VEGLLEPAGIVAEGFWAREQWLEGFWAREHWRRVSSTRHRHWRRVGSRAAASRTCELVDLA